MTELGSVDYIVQMKEMARSLSRRNAPFAADLSSVRSELRVRRKRFLGSYVSISSLVCNNGEIDNDALCALVDYLTEQTLSFWGPHTTTKETFARHFYRITIYALASGAIGQECIDDLIQFAECLARSRRIFTIVLKDNLPEHLHDYISYITETYDQYHFDANFEDAVLGAVCVFLEVIGAPVDNESKGGGEL